MANGRPKRIDMLIINDEAETPSFLNPMSGQIFVTNPVGKRLMELADGNRAVAAIVAELTREFKGASQDRVRAEADAFFAESTRKGLVQWVES